MIAINEIYYNHKSIEILKGINLEIEEGKCFALLGANGSGKSTLIDIISEILKPNRGTVLIDGDTFNNKKKDIGILFEYTPFFYYVTVKEWLKFLCVIYNINFNELKINISKLKMEDILSKQLQFLSKGERRKVSLLATFIHNPKILILDEPTPDLDPFMREIIWNIIKENNRTILFTTHLWEEVSNYADNVAFIDKGKILACESVKIFFTNEYLPSKQKIVLNQEYLQYLDSKNLKYILEEDNVNIYIDNIDFITNVLNQKRIKYTINDTGLKDVYWLLQKKNQNL